MTQPLLLLTGTRADFATLEPLGHRRTGPFMGLASLDVGTRQTNRAVAPSVTACAPSDTAAIAAFLAGECGNTYARHTGFGVGRAAYRFIADRFVTALQDTAFWAKSLQKEFHDLD